MAVGQCSFPNMHEVSGITLGTANAGIKQTVRDDILVIQMAEAFNLCGGFYPERFLRSARACGKSESGSCAALVAD